MPRYSRMCVSVWVIIPIKIFPFLYPSFQRKLTTHRTYTHQYISIIGFEMYAVNMDCVYVLPHSKRDQRILRGTYTYLYAKYADIASYARFLFTI